VNVRERERFRDATVRLYPEVAPGLHAYIAELWPDNVHTMQVRAVAAARPGSGALSRWLDTLSSDVRWEFWLVTSPWVERSLARRGFTCISRKTNTWRREAT